MMGYQSKEYYFVLDKKIIFNCLNTKMFKVLLKFVTTYLFCFANNSTV